MIENDDNEIDHVAGEQTDDIDPRTFELAGEVDQRASVLAGLAIDHPGNSIVDRLYLEGMAIAITARTLAFALPGRTAPATSGTRVRASRAIDYAHAHLTEGLTVSDLAAVACMSTSWLSRAFTAHTGHSVHAYVLEQRLE